VQAHEAALPRRACLSAHLLAGVQSAPQFWSVFLMCTCCVFLAPHCQQTSVYNAVCLHTRLQEYIRHLIYEVLSDGSIVEVLRKLMKLPHLCVCLPVCTPACKNTCLMQHV
jgi:hypothetical protein